jgi:hypothetical protein
MNPAVIQLMFDGLQSERGAADVVNGLAWLSVDEGSP